MDGKEIFASGRNIKCYDKIKILHQSTGWRLHANNKYYRDGSFNEVVSCHKARNDTDWYYIGDGVDKEANNPNHNLRNGDEIVLTHMISKKNVHTSPAYESPVSKNAEVSLCMSSGSRGCLEDVWKLELIDSQDEYWRVGEGFRLVNVQAKNYYLYTHKKKMDDFGGDFEVCSVKFEVEAVEGDQQQQSAPAEEANEDDSKTKNANRKYRQWLVCQNQPYIYTAPISTNAKAKSKAEAEQFERLQQIKINRDSLKKKEKRVNSNQTDSLIRFYDQSLGNRKPAPKPSCWKRYICCCCCPSEDPDEYYQHLAS